jgi:phospholipase D3/4
MDALTGGIVHTKFIIADDHSFYLGSANMDWKSLVEVKELGVVVRGSPELARDLQTVFRQYWFIAEHEGEPVGAASWPPSFDTRAFYEQVGPRVLPSLFRCPPLCRTKPLTAAAWQPARVLLNGTVTGAFLSVAPPVLLTPHRTRDDMAIAKVMEDARETICVSVMDYMPEVIHIHTPSPLAPDTRQVMYADPPTYFPTIDTAIRAAQMPSGQNVSVRLMFSRWNQTKNDMWEYLASLDVLHNVEVRIFEVPDLMDGRVYNFTRVNHAKYMVTEHQVRGVSRSTVTCCLQGTDLPHRAL